MRMVGCRRAYVDYVNYILGVQVDGSLRKYGFEGISGESG